MNPLTQTKNLQKLTERELQLGTAGTASSWHNMYKDSAWVFIGGLNYELNEGDVITVFSQYGEVVNVNLVRDKISGKSKGFAFLCYEDQRSTNLAVDNLNGITLVGRIIRVDHVEQYKVPKMDEMDEDQKKLVEEGCAPTLMALGGQAKPKSEIKPEIKEEKDKSREHSRRKDHEPRDEHRKRDSHHRPRSRSREREVRGCPSGRRRSRSRERRDRRSRSRSHEKSYQSSRDSRRHGDKDHEERRRKRSRERSRIK